MNKNYVFVQLDRRPPAYSMNSNIVSIFITRAMHFITKSCAYLSSLSKSPLFSSILTIHILLFLYFPPLLLKLVLSPVTILTFLLLVALLRSGSPCQPDRNPNPEPITEQEKAQDQPLFYPSQAIDSRAEPEFLPGSACVIDDSFAEWDVKAPAPLEVIYEEEEDEPAWNKDRPLWFSRLEKTSSLEVYYPETDSDTSSEGEFGLVGEMGWPGDPSILKWEGEDREGLIEIALDFGGGGSEKVYEDLHVEEDNMIEIDLSVGDD